MAKHIIKILILIIIFWINSYPQEDSIKIGTNSVSQSSFLMQKSPLGAVLRSAVIPGLGQIYNESYWKAPIIWGFISYFTYFWIKNNDDYFHWSDLYTNSLNKSNGNPNYKLNRDFYHDQRDLFAIYFGITYILNLLDAYVDAHLFDFDIKEDHYGKSTNFNLHIRL